MTEKFKRIHVVANPAAGQDQPVIAQLNRVFQQHDIDWELHLTKQLGDGATLAQQAIEAGADIVLAYGGDGTLMDVANGLYQSDVPMGVLAGGTGNGVAGAINTPSDLTRALQQICQQQGSVQSIDLGKVDDRVFILRVDIGGTVEAVDSADRETKDRFGVFAYLVSVARAFSRPNKIKYTLTVDDRTIQTEGAACMIANVNNLGTLDMKMNSDLRFDDGMIDAFVVNVDAQSVVGLLAALTNSARVEDMFEHYQGRTITVQTDDMEPVLLDGESIGDTPVHIETLPGALKLFIPDVEAE